MSKSRVGAKTTGRSGMKALVLEAKWSPKAGYRVSDWEKKTGKAVTGSSVWKDTSISVREVPTPKVGPKDVLIQLKACGVCGSDINFYETDPEGYIKYPGMTKFPVILGHEFSGKIVEVGRQVTDLKPGDIVTAEEMIWCGECVPCRNGFPNECVNLEEIGFTIPGAFAEYISVGAKYCWKLNALRDRYASEDEIYEAGATVEPLGVAYNGIFERAGGFRPGGYVAVFGAGPIGLSSVALCAAAGAAKIIVFEVNANRRRIAKTMGATHALDPLKVNPAEAVMEITGGDGADLLVEAAGAPTKTISHCVDSIAIDGRVIQIGRAADAALVNIEVFQVRHGQLFGTQGHSGNATFPNVIRLIASGRVAPLKMITHRFKLKDVVDAMERSALRQDGKIMVKI